MKLADLKSSQNCQRLRLTAAWCIALFSALAGPSIHAQGVTLGETVFNATSANADTTWYEPMRFGQATVLEGFGAKTGHTRSLTYSAGGTVAGVNTIKRQMVETAPALPGQTAGVATENMWVAFDAADDVRVLKIERAGIVVFEVKAGATPPLYIPSLPSDGQSWDLAGTTVTVEQVILSNSGCRLKINTVARDGKVETNFFHAGEGLLLTQSSGDSGYALKRPDTAR